MESRNEVTQLFLKECFDYDHESGVLIWKSRPRIHFKTYRSYRTWNKNYPGKEAGSKKIGEHVKSYIFVKLNGLKFGAHRIIWCWREGYWPDQIDHTDGDGANNSWVNLRDVTSVENGKNKRLNSKNKSGTLGVNLDLSSKKWRVTIGVDGKSEYLGQFKSKEAAKIRRMAAELKYGYHPNHGTERPL